MSHEVSPERAREIIIEKLNNFVLNYADVKRFDEIMQNRRMVNDGMSQELVAMYTGLTAEEIDAL